ncbi:hypothetical protein L204_100884 [Cryptococcus depauperatus]|nr:hypothetical protein L204_01184 [Cryptococcus depauperatus CBS 7855]
MAADMGHPQDARNGAISPTNSGGGRMTKAAFFRSRSPPIVSPTASSSGQSHNMGDSMLLRLDMDIQRDQERADLPIRENTNKALPVNQGAMMDGGLRHPVNPASTSSTPLPHPASASSRPSSHTAYSTRPPYSHARQSSRSRPTHSRQQSSHSQNPHTTLPGISRGMGSISSPNSDSGYERSMENTDRSPSMRDGGISLTEGSDEMHLTLLAGQAAMDCEGKEVGTWEEVGDWKKELSLLASRLDSAQSRHQRESKILTAARALQKLNNSNKRMSKQTTESLEQAEKKVEAAERDLLVLRDREGSLRKRLLEHYSSVMSWEIKRVSKVSSQTQVKLEHQSHKLASMAQREEDLIREMVENKRRAMEFESAVRELDKSKRKMSEMETVISEMVRRENRLEKEAVNLQSRLQALEQEKQAWSYERSQFDREKKVWSEEKEEWQKHLDNWDAERQHWKEEKEVLFGDRERLVQGGKISEKDRQLKDHVRMTVGSLLGRKAGLSSEEEIAPALEEVRSLLSRREQEVLNLKEEVKEVNMGLEEELKRIAEDRDAWKGRSEMAEGTTREEISLLEKRLRQQQDQISDLTLHNESLSTSLTAAQATLSSLPSPDTSQATQVRIDSLTSELEEMSKQLALVWPLLPTRSLREKADLIDPRTGASNRALASPSNTVNFEALQSLYSSHSSVDGKVGSVPEALERIKWMVEDGSLLIDRVVRMGKEREVLRANAAKAKKLVEDSTRNLETYQKQVTLLEDRLAKSSRSESHFLDELNSLQTTLTASQQSKIQLESQLAQQKEICARLSEANNTLSAKTLNMAQAAEDEKKNLAEKLQIEVDDLRKKLKTTEEDADEERAKSTGQRIKLLDELNSLQAEVGELRKQLRARS